MSECWSFCNVLWHSVTGNNCYLFLFHLFLLWQAQCSSACAAFMSSSGTLYAQLLCSLSLTNFSISGMELIFLLWSHTHLKSKNYVISECLNFCFSCISVLVWVKVNEKHECSLTDLHLDLMLFETVFSRKRSHFICWNENSSVYCAMNRHCCFESLFFK